MVETKTQVLDPESPVTEENHGEEEHHLSCANAPIKKGFVCAWCLTRSQNVRVRL